MAAIVAGVLYLIALAQAGDCDLVRLCGSSL